MDKEQLSKKISEDCQRLQDTLNRVQSGLADLDKEVTKKLQEKAQK